MPLRASDVVSLSEARAGLTDLAEDAIAGLRQALAGQFVAHEDPDQVLGISTAPPTLPIP